MSRRSSPRKSWFTLLLILAAAGIWLYNESQLVFKTGGQSGAERESLPPKTIPVPRAPRKTQSPQRKSARYEMYENCTLAEARNNDGDSFLVRLPDGRTEEFRLYFVDTPESDFKSYPDGETNYDRIRQQAAEMGGITPEQAVEIGKKGRKFTLDLLASRPFTLYTEWDSPFRDNRYHAHIQILQKGKPRWLHQVLIEKGLARVKTKPADLPNGITAEKEQEHLRALERFAKRSEAGVWGL